MSLSFLVLGALLPALVSAVPCVQFDTSWNLYAFGGSQDVNLGQNTTWGSPSAKTLSTSGRPPWTGNYTQCFLQQNNNIMLVLGADASDLSKVYVYNFASDAWSTQTTSSAPSNLGNSRSSSILDHDTNVIFTLPGGSGQSLYQLDLSSITSSAGSSALAWQAVESPSFSTDGYTVTAAEASNHINYFGVPNTAAGSADIFVIHFAVFQNESQSYPTQGGGTTFPDTAGAAIGIPDAENNAGDQMIFIPNDFSNTYVVTHWTNPGDYTSLSGAPFATSLINTTQILAAPTSHDSAASYAASPNDLVQIDSSGNIYYMNSIINSDFTVSTSASWTKMNYQLSGTGSSSNSTTSASASASGSATGSASGTGSKSSGASASKTSGAAASSSGAAAGKVDVNFSGWGVLSMGLVALVAGLLL